MESREGDFADSGPVKTGKTHYGIYITMGILGLIILGGMGFLIFSIFLDVSVDIAENKIIRGIDVELLKGEEISFMMDGEKGLMKFVELEGNKTNLKINNKSFNLILFEETFLDLDADGEFDLNITVNEISNESVNIFIKKIKPLEGVTLCVENWSCTTWTECSESNQERNCTDLNNCSTDKKKPVISRNCTENCIEYYRYLCNETLNQVIWYNSCGKFSAIKDDCDDDEWCDFDKCVLRSCENRSGEVCDDYLICNEEVQETSDTDFCCLGNCKTRLCSSSEAKSVADDYLNYNLESDYDSFKEVINIDCDKNRAECRDLFEDSEELLIITSFTYDQTTTSNDNETNIVYYDADANGTAYEIKIYTTENYILGDCRVDSHSLNAV